MRKDRIEDQLADLLGGRYLVVYDSTDPKPAIGIAYCEGRKIIRQVLKVAAPTPERNIECEVACEALNELFQRTSEEYRIDVGIQQGKKNKIE